MNNKFIMGAIIGAAAMYLLTNMGKGQSTDTPIKVPPIKKDPMPLPSTIPDKPPVILRGLIA
jgi:hypothetical protein